MSRAVPGAAFALCLLLAPPAPAAGSDWEVELTPYAWLIGARGDARIGPLSAGVDVGFADLVRRLNLAFMLGAEARWGRFLLLGDGRYTSLADHSAGGSTRFDLDQAIVELALGYRVAEGLGGHPVRFDVLAGARYHYNDLRLAQQVPILGPLGFDVAESFAEPIVGARVGVTPWPRLDLELEGDVGGFGLGSELSYGVRAMARWRLTRRWKLGVGYRLLGVDFQDGNALGGTRLDLRYFGPVLGVSYSFGPGVRQLSW